MSADDLPLICFAKDTTNQPPPDRHRPQMNFATGAGWSGKALAGAILEKL